MVNYRLGALGFLVYGSNVEIGGNYGLKVGGNSIIEAETKFMVDVSNGFMSVSM